MPYGIERVKEKTSRRRKGIRWLRVLSAGTEHIEPHDEYLAK